MGPHAATVANSGRDPGVAAAGGTEEETVELMREAIEFHLEGLKEDREPIPEPSIIAKSIEIAV